MKRLCKLLLFVPILIFFSGCSKAPEYKIGISQCSDDDWRQKMNAEVEREMMFHPEVEYEIRSADDNNEKQIADIRYYIENGYDAIIVAPNEADAITPVINEAMERGIPVVLFDRSVNGDNYTAWLGADNASIGRSAAIYLESLVGPEARVLEIKGLPASTPAIGRHNGFASGSLDIAAVASGNWNYDDAARSVDSLLKLYPDAKAIFAHNDRMAIAAADVAKRHGVDPYIIGVDGAPQIGVKAVNDTVIDATFLYPTEGAAIVNTALDILEGRPYNKIRSFPASSAINKSNVDIVMQQDESLNEEVQRMQRLKSQVDEYWSQHTSQTTALYAVILVSVLLAGVIFLLLRAFWQHRRHQEALMHKNRQLEEERDKQKQLMEQVDAATASKLAFFTNVSHDLRTPLTLITEPVAELSQAVNLTQRQQTLAAIANKNISILRRLINQILDFRKFENGRLDLNPVEINISELFEDWASAFRPLALRRDIKFITSFPQGCTMAIDVPKYESIFYNLVSNAFKFTPDNGSISIVAECDGASLTLKVSDSGQGISEEDLPQIFDRFFRVERVQATGSGIGLALAKAFAELHGGAIEAESTLGKGSVFKVTIPVSHVEKRDDVSAHHISSASVDTELSAIETETDTADVTEGSERPLVLAIDDNADILAMLTQLLSDGYRVITASNGTEGLRKAAKNVPDIVICDVMMPEMDGLECCRRLKEEISTSHIPVLMLTACALDEQRVSGYRMGADGYLSKPFSSEVLLIRIQNLLENRKRIRGIDKNPSVVGASASHDETRDIKDAVSPDIDNEFYKRFLALVNERIDDPDMNVDAIASEMGLGRSQFYRKIKSLTNYSPVELLRRIRLNRARTLLTRTEKTISEISYAVGFSTPAYFTKCYRDAFGETPSELRARLAGN